MLVLFIVVIYDIICRMRMLRLKNGQFVGKLWTRQLEKITIQNIFPTIQNMMIKKVGIDGFPE